MSAKTNVRNYITTLQHLVAVLHSILEVVEKNIPFLVSSSEVCSNTCSWILAFLSQSVFGIGRKGFYKEEKKNM